MATLTYHERRSQLQAYFDRTAVDAWARLTSTAPVSLIRATVRAGRERMRRTLLGYLPADLRGREVLDAGCGTGMLSVEAARRGARVLGVDLSPSLVALARDRLPTHADTASIEFRVGDAFDKALGGFDHVIAMDSLIHYRAADVVRILADFAARTQYSIVFTYAPRTPLLTIMWAVGRLFPRKDRAPALEPISERSLRRRLACEPALTQWRIGRTQRIASAFYKCQAMELVKQ
jgi:magnesium-protoporphyrin O-methyltransferase